MKNKKIIIFLLISVLTLTLISCTNDSNEVEDVKRKENNEIKKVEKENSEDSIKIDNESEDDSEEDVSHEEIPIEEIEVNLYYANLEYIETGNEDLDKLVPIKKTFNTSKTNLEKSVVEELQKKPDDESLTTLIRDDITILDVFNDNGTAVVDFSSQNLNGGSLEESFIISQIVQSLIELDNVEEVQFLVDGAVTDSLMGHISLEAPFTE